MSSLLYLVAVILIIGWALGFFLFSAGSIIHLLLVLAVIAILLRLIRGGERLEIIEEIRVIQARETKV